MIVEIISTGTELLLGEITNINTPYLARQLNSMGYSVLYETTVGDNPVRMEAVLSQALQRADMVITTGGLGPTQGDMTKIIGAKVMGVGMHYDPSIEASIVKWIELHRPGKKITDSQKRQAMIPDGAVVLTNEVGTAPGVYLQRGTKTLVHLPGPPAEMTWMFENRLKPWLLKANGSQGDIQSLYLKIYDMGEAIVEEKLMDLVKKQSNPTIAFYARPGFVEVRLTAKGPDKDGALALIEPLRAEIVRRLGGVVVTYDDETIASVLGRVLTDGKYTIGAAESCTGGLIGSLITDVAGASNYFRGSAGTYCNEMKHKLLGVRQETLDTFTEVSPETAAEMAEGAKELYGCDFAVSTTGIAGPGGGTEDKPVGLVYTGITGPWGTQTYRNVYHGDRQEVKRRAALKAIYYVVEYIKRHQ